MALPPELLTDAETRDAFRLVDRVDTWLATRRLLLVCALLEKGWTETRVLDLLLERAPAVFRQPDDD